ncbi:hypothetical protein [Nonomuraea sp. B19D2]|uniref:SDH family Clp fold serine proteinase n=1 Tax=Nonomuraea sp. B19D2 TaxID=3159561 RepID=UPI0032DA6D40
MADQQSYFDAFLTPDLHQMELSRGRPVIAYYGMIIETSAELVYEQLRTIGRTARLDFLLNTRGGVATAARATALLLREYTDHLTILVPHRAWSAGTLICLGADELVLTPMSQLGPLDPRIGASTGVVQGGGSGILSAEDVKAFSRLAKDWYGIHDKSDLIQVLALLAQRVSPTSLGSFYRAELLIRDMARELLHYQLREKDADEIDTIVDRLVSGYHSHDYVITRADAERLGLRVTHALPAEEELLWSIVQALRYQTTAVPGADDTQSPCVVTSSRSLTE